MIECVIDQRSRNLGGGLTVRRILPFVSRRMVGPFIFFDHMGPVNLPAGIPDEMDVRPHPHIGLSTVTYLYEGEIMHRDSVGSEQAIMPGEVNWMTAGRGITHSERFERARSEGGRLHGIQAWVALPEADEECDPTFTHHGTGDLPLLEEKGVSGRLIAGKAMGLEANVRTHSPLSYIHWDLAASARAELPADYPERAIYVAAGAVELDNQRIDAGRMAILSPGFSAAFLALEPATVMVIAGEPVGERFIDWNFVSSSKERLEQAKADWRAQRMKLPDLDHDSFIPLPPEPGHPAPAMS
jgi:redox-sensitive bicupin YhaK (pirin superfamily)